MPTDQKSEFDSLRAHARFGGQSVGQRLPKSCASHLDLEGIYQRLVSNLKCVCRKHHLLKTFYSGPGGWADRQLPDGTVIWTSPTGATYSTLPGSRLLFPTWNSATAELASPPTTSGPTHARGIMMPVRRRTRAAQRAFRIRCERALNDAHVAERNKPPPF